MGGRLFIDAIDGRRVQEELAYPFDQSRVVIGRAGAADVRLPHRTVSERHASLEQSGNHYVLTDHGSTNGTRVSGERLVAHRGRKLRDGDTIELGIYVLSFHDEVMVTAPLTSERTAELARRLLRGQAGDDTPAPSPPRLVVVSGPLSGQSLDLPEAPCRITVGRKSDCDLALPDDTLAPEEFLLERDLDGVLAQSVHTDRPMQIGRRVTRSHRLKDGDEIIVGTTTLLFEEPAEAALGAMTQDEDEPVKARPLPPPEPLPKTAPETGPPEEAPSTEAVEEAEAEPRPSRSSKPAPRPQGLGADLLVYGLAGIVLSLSIAGLIMLLRAH